MFPAEDLWDCLEQASGKPIAAVMGSWTKQMGFPIIVVDQEQVSSSLSCRTDLVSEEMLLIQTQTGYSRQHHD